MSQRQNKLSTRRTATVTRFLTTSSILESTVGFGVGGGGGVGVGVMKSSISSALSSSSSDTDQAQLVQERTDNDNNKIPTAKKTTKSYD